MLATVYGLRRELLRRGEEALVVRLNFVFFRLILRTLRTKDVFGVACGLVYSRGHLTCGSKYRYMFGGGRFGRQQHFGFS
jgi:hypothetical protein